MANRPYLLRGSNPIIYKRRPPQGFDFFWHAYQKLLKNSADGRTLKRREVHSIFSQSFHFDKSTTKIVLEEMVSRKLIVNGKRGIELCQG